MLRRGENRVLVRVLRLVGGKRRKTFPYREAVTQTTQSCLHRRETGRTGAPPNVATMRTVDRSGPMIKRLPVGISFHGSSVNFSEQTSTAFSPRKALLVSKDCTSFERNSSGPPEA